MNMRRPMGMLILGRMILHDGFGPQAMMSGFGMGVTHSSRTDVALSLTCDILCKKLFRIKSLKVILQTLMLEYLVGVASLYKLRQWSCGYLVVGVQFACLYKWLLDQHPAALSCAGAMCGHRAGRMWWLSAAGS